MARWTPDPTFYPSPRLAGSAPPETLGYVALVEPTQEGRPDALGVIDLEPGSSDYGSIVSTLEMPNIGDELHHFGWNACSAALCPSAPRPHVERRYLLVPGLRSSRMHVIDTKPDPRAPQLARDDRGARSIARRTGYSRPHTTHCGPDAIYVSRARAAPTAATRAAASSCSTATRSTRWAPGRSTAARSATATTSGGTSDTTRCCPASGARPAMFENGVVPEKLLGREYGHHDARLGSAQAPPHAGARPRRRSIRWCSSCGRRTIRARRTGSSAWSSRSRICPPRSGCGTATGPTGRSRR